MSSTYLQTLVFCTNRKLSLIKVLNKGGTRKVQYSHLGVGKVENYEAVCYLCEVIEVQGEVSDILAFSKRPCIQLKFEVSRPV